MESNTIEVGFNIKEFTFNKLKFIQISHTIAGFVTIDLKNRGYRFGNGSIHGDLLGSGDYVGRGWKERLIADAKKALIERNMA